MKNWLSRFAFGVVILAVGFAAGSAPIDTLNDQIGTFKADVERDGIPLTKEDKKVIIDKIMQLQGLVNEQGDYIQKLEDKVRELVKKTNCA